jgi:hypothetical protein
VIHALTRFLELFITNRKLSSAKPHVLNALAGLALVIGLGVFATVFAALMVCAMLWLGYAQLLGAGADIATAGLIVAAVSLVLVVAAVLIALRAWRTVREEVLEVFRTQTPLAPVTDTAGAFLDGLFAAGKRAKVSK